MKKVYQLMTLMLFASLFLACSEDNTLIGDTEDAINASIPERAISIIESEQFNNYSANPIRSATSFIEDGKIMEVLNYDNDVLDWRVIYEYNSQGLLKRVSNFDGNNTPLLSRDFSIVYDEQNRIRNIVYENRIFEFTYNSIDQTITRRAFNSSNPNLSTATYSLNENGQILRFESSYSNILYVFEYINGKLMGATRTGGGFSNLEVDYDYDTSQETKGFNYHKMYKAMYGSPINAVLASERSIENMISLYYGEENPSLLAYYIEQPSQELITRFEYTRDEQNYVTEFEMIANGSLYSRIKITYED